MLKKISRSINPASLDLYGTKPNLLVQGESISYSGVGIFSSFLVLGFVIWASYINASELFKKETPNLTTANLPSSTINEPIELTPENFDFAFGMVNIGDNTFYIDKTIYTAEAVFYPVASDKHNFIMLDIEECEPSYLNAVSNIKGILFCLKKTQSKLSSINLLTKQDAYVSINFHKCQTGCSPLMNNILEMSFCGRLYSDWKINPFNYEQPLERYYKGDWSGLVLGQTKATYLYLTRTEFKSDNGWLTSNTKTTNIVSVEKIESDSGDLSIDSVLYRLMIATSGNKNIYLRNYIKIQDVLAQIGSLCSGFIFLLGILVYPYSNLKMYEGLVNKAFYVKTSSHDGTEEPSPLEFGDLSLNKKLESSTNRINDLTNMDQSRIGDNDSQRRLYDNVDASEIKGNDLTVHNISQDKIDYISELPTRTKEIELSQRRLQPQPTPGVQDNPSLLREATNAIELPGQKADAPLKKILVYDLMHMDEPKIDDNNSRPIHAENTDAREKTNNAIELSSMKDDIPPKKTLPADVEVDKRANEQSITDTNQQAGEKRRFFGCLRSKTKSRVVPVPTRKKQSPLRIGYFEFLLSFFRKKPKMKAIEKGSRQIMLKLDFLLIFKKLHEIDRLKMCLMTPDQRLLFESIQKPILELAVEGKRKKKKHHDDGEESETDEERWPTLSELREAYLNLKRAGCMTTLDRNLVFNYEKNRDAIEAMAR